MDFEVAGSGLGFPEGPVVMEDGSVILVEIQKGCISRVWNGKHEVIATPAAAPTASPSVRTARSIAATMAASSTMWSAASRFPAIVRRTIPAAASSGSISPPARLSGFMKKSTETRCAARTTSSSTHPAASTSPTSAKASPHPRSWRCLLCQTRRLLHQGDRLHHISPNGCGLSPDGHTLYFADTMTSRLWAYALTGPGEYTPHMPPFLRGRVVTGQTELCYFDSLAVAASGNVCVATILKNGGMGGITTIRPDGSYTFTEVPDPFVTNIAFGGKDMHDAWICASGTGQLLKTRWPEAGLKLNFNG